jgi:hypothetical protein
MNAEPISKELYNKLIAADITSVKLAFSGGSDEGYLDVYLYGSKDVDYQDEGYRKLNEEVEEWAWSVYGYSGAGDGSDYGDDIEYDLVNKKVKTSEWYTERTYGDDDEGDLVIEDEGN